MINWEGVPIIRDPRLWDKSEHRIPDTFELKVFSNGEHRLKTTIRGIQNPHVFHNCESWDISEYGSEIHIKFSVNNNLPRKLTKSASQKRISVPKKHFTTGTYVCTLIAQDEGIIVYKINKSEEGQQ